MISLPDAFGPPTSAPVTTDGTPADRQPLARPPEGDRTGPQDGRGYGNAGFWPAGYGIAGPNGGTCANPCGFPNYGSLYLGTYATYRWMLQHPIVRHARQQVIDPIIAAAPGFDKTPECPPERLDFVKGVVGNIWTELVADLLRAIDYGWMPAEKVWAYAKGKAEIECLKPLAVDATGIIADPSGRFAGLRCNGLDNQPVDLGVRQAFLFTYDGEFGNLHGRSRLENIRATAWRDWLDAATDLAKLCRKISGKLGILKTPNTGGFKDASQTLRPWSEMGQVLGQILNSDASLLHFYTMMPESRIATGAVDYERLIELNKTSLVTLEIQDFGSNAPAIASILERQRADEERMFAGYYQSPRTGMATVGGTKADAQQHTDTATVNAENLCARIARAVTKGVVDDLLALNWGDDARGSVWVVPAQLTDDNLATDMMALAALFANADGLGTAALEKMKWPVVFDRRGIPHVKFEKLEAVETDDGEDTIGGGADDEDDDEDDE